MERSQAEPVTAGEKPPHRAELVFAFVAFGIGLFLLSQIGSQVTWSSSKSLINQPGFWPVMAICGMVLFGAGELIVTVRRFRSRATGDVAAELFDWLKAIEFAGWFLVYVTVVPTIGYLLATLLFCVLLTWRLGYRSRPRLAAAALTGFSIVLVFKSMLSVKIPGGQIYESLPAALRNFMILNF
ncbi:MAG: tripartite tricarboxylate transporter TctB family protein [Rhizobiaceae bacterium]